MFPPVFVPDPRIGQDPHPLRHEFRAPRRHERAALRLGAVWHAAPQTLPDAPVGEPPPAPPQACALVPLAMHPRFAARVSPPALRLSLRGALGIQLLRLGHALLRGRHAH